MSTWLEGLDSFDESTRRAFRFLIDEMRFNEPRVEFERDYFLVYKRPQDSVEVRVGLERDWLIPLIFVGFPEEDDPCSWVPEAAAKLNLSVDTSRFPKCHQIEKIRGIVPFFLRGQRLHERHYGELMDETSHYLLEYARVLQENFELILNNLDPPKYAAPFLTGEASTPSAWIVRVLVLAAISFLSLRYCS